MPEFVTARLDMEPRFREGQSRLVIFSNAFINLGLTELDDRAGWTTEIAEENQRAVRHEDGTVLAVTDLGRKGSWRRNINVRTALGEELEFRGLDIHGYSSLAGEIPALADPFAVDRANAFFEQYFDDHLEGGETVRSIEAEFDEQEVAGAD